MTENRRERIFYQALDCLFSFFEVAGVRSLQCSPSSQPQGFFCHFCVGNCVENCHYLKTKQIVVLTFKAVCCVSHCHNPPVCQIQTLCYNIFRYMEMPETLQNLFTLPKQINEEKSLRVRDEWNRCDSFTSHSLCLIHRCHVRHIF